MENTINELTPEPELENSPPTTNNESYLYEVEAQNRVIRIKNRKRIRGRQGDWHQEKLLVVAENENEAENEARRYIAERPIIGKPGRSRMTHTREIEIDYVRRI